MSEAEVLDEAQMLGPTSSRRPVLHSDNQGGYVFPKG